MIVKTELLVSWHEITFRLKDSRKKYQTNSEKYFFLSLSSLKVLKRLKEKKYFAIINWKNSKIWLSFRISMAKIWNKKNLFDNSLDILGIFYYINDRPSKNSINSISTPKIF